MPSLRFHLQQMPHRDLRAVVTRLNLRLSVPDKRPGWIDAIESHWLHAESRAVALGSLSDSAKAALVHLAHVDDLPALLFWAEYGSIRRYGEDYPLDQTPWLHPQTVSEELYYAGLLHAGRHSGKRKSVYKAQSVTLPDNLRPLLAQTGYEKSLLHTEVEHLLHDIAQFLIYLHQSAELTLLHGRWLPPTALQALVRRLKRAQQIETAASHKQHNWLRFLAFLAQAARLVHDGQLTTQGWHWLAQKPERQLAILWDAWLSAPSELRQDYACVGAGLAAPWHSLIVRTLRQQTGLITPARFAGQMLGIHEFQTFFVANFEDLYALEQVIADMFAEDLSLLGVVKTQPDETTPALSAVLHPYRLTSAGAWLLHPVLNPPPQQAKTDEMTLPPASLLQDTAEEWLIQCLDSASPLLQARLAQYTEYVMTTERGELHHSYRLHRASMAQAAARGNGVPTLLETLRALQLEIPSELHQQILAWHEHGRRFSVQQMLVLRSRSAQDMSTLHQNASLADLFSEILSPTVAVLGKPPEQVSARLEKVGIFLSNQVNPPIEQAESGQRRLSEEADGARWLAGKLYALLAEFLALPLPPFTLQLATLWQRLSHDEQAILSAQADLMEAALRSLLDGFASTPAPSPSDPERWLSRLTEAIANEQTLAITYFTAGRNLLTRRMIQPYWIEEHRGVAYVRAYCHSAERVLTFRLDRIQSLD
jgi:hypothetical protein